jgi:cytochrome b6-f complex iron-sulfur subunit
MERRDFLNNLSCMASLLCAGSLLEACSKSAGSTQTNTNGNTPLISANLDTELAAIGAAKVNGSVIVVRVADGNASTSFVALSLICTHQGCAVKYDESSDKFKCPCHGSEFAINGAVLQGPAADPLKKYTVTVSGNTLTVA